MDKYVQLDLFGNEVEQKNDLKRDFGGANPFTILDTKDSMWQARKKMWIGLGIKSEEGRDATTYNMKDWVNKKSEEGALDKRTALQSDTSIFDPVLCELMYRWFCPVNGTILDPFAGGSVRGIVAHYLGYKYTGIDIRQEQIDSNNEQAVKILGAGNMPKWITGDSNIVLDDNLGQFDMVFTCPPYADLEVYSDLDGDISNMEYPKFIKAFESIMSKACAQLKHGGTAIVVVGEIRDNKGNYRGFVADTVKFMQGIEGMKFYNDAVLATSLVTAGLRAGGNMKSGKLVKIHQNILTFRKD
jgi:DNA modification methylase